MFLCQGALSLSPPLALSLTVNVCVYMTLGCESQENQNGFIMISTSLLWLRKIIQTLNSCYGNIALPLSLPFSCFQFYFGPVTSQ